MTNRQAVVEAVKGFYETISTKRVSTSILQSDEHCGALADAIMAKDTTEWDYWVEHDMADGTSYGSSRWSQAIPPMSTPWGATGQRPTAPIPLEDFEKIIVDELRQKPGVTSIRLMRIPLRLGGGRSELVKTY